MDIQSLILQPESKTLEFKQDLSSLKPILKTIVAFANTAGGVLIIGRTSEGDVIGVEDPLLSEERLANTISENIFPALMPDIEISTVQGKAILIVKVAHQYGPFYLKNEGLPQGVYIRLGTTSRKASQELIAELQRFQKGLSFDQLPCANLTPDDLDSNRVKHYLETIGKNNERKFLETLGIITPLAGSLIVSNGGMILFGKDESRLRYFPSARVTCARFKGTDKSVFIDRKDLQGTILEAVPEVLKFIQINTRLSSQIRSIKREDLSEYPEVAIREVLINALAHADYSLGGRIQVAIFDDRLEIQNPGMLPLGLTLADFKAGISRIRNHVITRVFRELNFMEEWGSGYHRSTSYCKTLGYPEPEWQEMGSTIRVIFRPHPSFKVYSEMDVPVNDTVNVPVNDTVNLQFNERQTWFLEQLKKGKHLRSPDLKKQWQVSGTTAKRDILVLQEQKLIEFVGSPKKGTYKLILK